MGIGCAPCVAIADGATSVWLNPRGVCQRDTSTSWSSAHETTSRVCPSLDDGANGDAQPDYFIGSTQVALGLSANRKGVEPNWRADRRRPRTIIRQGCRIAEASHAAFAQTVGTNDLSICLRRMRSEIGRRSREMVLYVWSVSVGRVLALATCMPRRGSDRVEADAGRYARRKRVRRLPR